MPFLHALTDYRQIAPENVEITPTYGNYKNCELLKIQHGGRPPSWIYQNVNNFRVEWAFWLKFELHIPNWHNRNWKISSEMQNFENPTWRPAAILDLPKC